MRLMFGKAKRHSMALVVTLITSSLLRLWIALGGLEVHPSPLLEPGLGQSSRDDTTLSSQLPPQQLQARGLGMGFSFWAVRRKAFESRDRNFSFASGRVC